MQSTDGSVSDSSTPPSTPPRVSKPAQLPPPHRQILGCILNTQRANIHPVSSTQHSFTFEKSKDTQLQDREASPLSAQVLPKVQSVDVGKSATFNCSTTGHPVVTIEWMKDGMPLRAGSRIEFPSRDVVHLTYVQRDDKGMFQCFVSNDFDSAQGTAQLTLGGE
ncbi:down syndrome cell adhesion molecule [Caerostris darwini]|uniref:Down syndrome cell adhesion molecule n=1 Tax=Caerostris darwini TaxID=1538125 RepID=A0AAV4V7G3_9ARAC|nr:down syndrome cell adhesion molecule [Caerostris darwini]